MSPRSSPHRRSETAPYADGRGGLTRWAHGDLVCYVSPSPPEAKLRWTDTYGVLDARDRDIASHHDAWLAHGTRQAG